MAVRGRTMTGARATSAPRLARIAGASAQCARERRGGPFRAGRPIPCRGVLGAGCSIRAGFGRRHSARTFAEAPTSGGARIPTLDESKPVFEGENVAAWVPAAPGVYALFDKAGELQYIGLSRKISASVEAHAATVSEDMETAQVISMPGATKEGLQAVWQQWIQAFAEQTGGIPPGNAPGESRWKLRRPKAPKGDLKLTPGKGVEDLTISMDELIDRLVKSVKVVAFIKGTRTQPECGFSYQVLTLLNKTKVEYETVNVLDAQHNPGLREAIKLYSTWPTIPQLYAHGTFVGGADIVTELDEKGELASVLKGGE